MPSSTFDVSTTSKMWVTGIRTKALLRLACGVGLLVSSSALITLATTSFPTPAGAAANPGTLYVANTGNDTVSAYPIPPTSHITMTIAPAQEAPQYLTLDASGDLWVDTYEGVIEEFTPSQLSSSGSPTPAVTISGTLNGPGGLAFDAAGDLWVASIGSDSLVEYTPAQLAASGNPTPAVTISAASGSLSYPDDLAFDSAGDLWVVNAFTDGTVVEYTPAQLASSGSPTPQVTISTASPGFLLSGGLAFDPAGDLWVEDTSSNSLVEYTPSQLSATGSPTPAVAISSATLTFFGGLAFDASGDLWAADGVDSLVLEYSAAQLTASGSPTPAVSLSGSSNGISSPLGIAIKTTTPLPSQIFGQDAIGTAIAVSQVEFPTVGSAKAVVLARSDFFSDALAGGPLAAAMGGPLLITPGASLSTSLDPRVQAEIQRVLPGGDTVYILGGDLAVSPDIDIALENLGYKVVRVAGADEYATAVDIAETLGNPTTIFEATGLNFPDALSAVPAAIENHGAILLTDGTTQAPETAAYLAANPNDTRYAIGGPLAAAGADPTAIAVYGSDEYATSAAVANQFFPGANLFGAATGLNYPDALAGGVFMATGGRLGPILLLDPSANPPVPSAIAAYLATLSTGTQGFVFGGPLAIPGAVLADIQAAVG